MKLGMNLLLYTTQPDESIFGKAEELKAMGFDGLEWPVLATDLATAKKIGQFNADQGLGATTVYVFGPDASPISPDKALRDKAREVLTDRIEVTAALGGTVLCGPIVQTLGHFTGQPRTDDEWKYCVEFFQEMGPVADQHNVTLAVEYLNRFEIYFLNTSADANKLCAEVNHPRVTVLVDSFHANIEETSQYNAVMHSKEHLGHIHISENTRGVPGSGKIIDWDGFFKGIKDSGFDGYLTIESFGQALPDLAAAAKIWRPLFENQEDVPREGIKFIKEKLNG